MSDESGSNGGGGGGDDLSGLSGFFFYVFIVHPATAWILRPGRFERKKSIIYAIGFLALLAAVKTGELFTCVLYAGVLCPLFKNSSAHHASSYPISHFRNGNASHGTKPLFPPERQSQL